MISKQRFLRPETRDYVQAIDRNVEIYRAIDDYARRKSTVASYRTR